MRLFVAVSPSAEAVADLGAVVDGLEVSRANQPGHSTRLAPRDRWHITLAFLGDVPTAKATAAEAAITSAATVAAFPLCFAGGGTFCRGRSAILWCGVDGDRASLRLLGDSLRRALRRARLPYDRKPLRPHLTISRPGARVPPDAIAADVATLTGYRGPLWTVDHVQLMVSEMEQTATGPQPRYTPVATVPLP